MEKQPRRIMQPSSWLLVFIVLLGAWMRIEVTLRTQVEGPIRSDAIDYYSYAYNLRHYGVYSKDRLFAQANINTTPHPDALRTPGYPLFLSAFAGIAPEARTILNITLAQALLGILVIPLTFLIARQFLTSTWSLLPTLLTAISPQLINCSVYVLSESLFTFLMVASIACLSVHLRKPRNHQWLPLLGSLLIGAAALTRPTLNYVVPFLVLALLPFLPKDNRWAWTVKVIAGFALMTLPWMLRNWIVLGGSDPTLAINTLVHGHYPGLMYNGDPQSLGAPYRYDPQSAQMSTSIGAALRGIWSCFASDPITYTKWYLIGKPVMFFSWDDVAAWGDIFTYPTLISPYYNTLFFAASKYLMQILHPAWIALAAVTTFFSLSKWKNEATENKPAIIKWLLVVVFIYFLTIHIIGFPIARYCIPLLPVIFILATDAVAQLGFFLHRRKLPI